MKYAILMPHGLVPFVSEYVAKRFEPRRINAVRLVHQN